MSFAMNTLLFYAAAWYVRDGAAAGRIFGALGLATMLVVVMALEQRYGGVERLRVEGGGAVLLGRVSRGCVGRCFGGAQGSGFDQFELRQSRRRARFWARGLGDRWGSSVARGGAGRFGLDLSEVKNRLDRR